MRYNGASQLSQMIIAICTLFSIGKLREGIVYSRNDDFQQILPFIDADGDSICAGMNLRDFITVGYKILSKVDTT